MSDAISNIMPTIIQFDPIKASNNDFIKRLEFINARQAEAMPDDPPTPLDISINNVKGWPLLKSLKLELWQLWVGDVIVAELFLIAEYAKHNNHLFDFYIDVLAPYRGKGYAKLLLPKLLNFAETHNRRLGKSFTTSRIPAGQGFAEHLNANKGIDETTSQLLLSSLNPTLVQDWLELGIAVEEDFEMGFWGNVYPEEDIQAIAKLRDVMNTAPKDDLDMEDTETTPARLRESEAYLEAQGSKRSVGYVRHKESGEFAGYTETYWEPEKPDVIAQGGTVVVPKYRGYKLGKWLKAAMVQKIMLEQPTVKAIRTDNAASNAAMLAINDSLGFEFYESIIIWQFEVNKVKSYLQ